jgi:IS5 family transposase
VSRDDRCHADCGGCGTEFPRSQRARPSGHEAEALPESAKPLDSRIARKLSNQTHRSCTDPDATLAEKKGSPRQLKYKVHQSIDADSRVILDTHVTTGARHDNQPYLAQLQRIEQRCRITILEAIADRGYGSAQIIRTLQEQGKRTFIPLWSGRVGNSKYLRGDLVYQKEHDRFQCPAGKYLTPTPAITENHKRYVASSADCRACAQASTCPARRSGSSPKRFVLRSLDQDLFEEVQARMRDPTFRTRRSERMWKMEGLFAEAKQNHSLSRARYRGRSKVQIQAYLSAIVQNLKRLVAALWCWLITQSLNRLRHHDPNHRSCQKSRLIQQARWFFGVCRKRSSFSEAFRAQAQEARKLVGRLKGLDDNTTDSQGVIDSARGRLRRSSGVEDLHRSHSQLASDSGLRTCGTAAPSSCAPRENDTAGN